MTIYVQFKDVDEVEIVSVFSSPQDKKYYENLGEVEESDGRLRAFYGLFSRENGPALAMSE